MLHNQVCRGEASVLPIHLGIWWLKGRSPCAASGLEMAAVFSSPFLPPASTTILQMVMRSSMLMASIAVPVNSIAL